MPIARRSRGRSSRAAELDEYRPGDDVRHIDWNATGRMGKPFVRRYHEEREGTVMLVVHPHRQMHFGSSAQRKVDTAAEAAALLAVLAVRNQDRVGLVTFGEPNPMGLAPAKGMDPAMRIIRELVLVSDEYSREVEPISGAIERCARLLRRSAMELRSATSSTSTRWMRCRCSLWRHEVLCLAVRDPLERALPNAGLLRVEGLGVIDTSDSALRARYRSERERAEAEVRQATRDAAQVWWSWSQVMIPCRRSWRGCAGALRSEGLRDVVGPPPGSRRRSPGRRGGAGWSGRARRRPLLTLPITAAGGGRGGGRPTR